MQLDVQVAVVLGLELAGLELAALVLAVLVRVVVLVAPVLVVELVEVRVAVLLRLHTCLVAFDAPSPRQELGIANHRCPRLDPSPYLP